MQYHRLLELLRSRPAFVDLDAWQVEAVPGGTVAEHVYRLRGPEGECFVKTCKPNEVRVLRLIHALGLDVAPRILEPELLPQGVLVAEWLTGGHARGHRLDGHLIAEMAAFHKALNDSERVRAAAPWERSFRVTREPDFYRDTVRRVFREGPPKLAALKLDLPIAARWLALAERLQGRVQGLAEAYATMPYAWLHHDLREANIVGTPQRVADWGSSYGHGPFLYDLAPFMANDPDGLAYYCARSPLCAGIDQATIEGWLVAALAARFGGWLTWCLPIAPASTLAEWEALLAYEFAPLAPLETALLP